MRTCDVLVVGGGPAGSSAARQLKLGGASVLVLDKERFPRLKLCAGWITPEVVRDLGMDVASYPHRFLTFERLHVHLKGLHFRLSSVQHSIRRFEFDAWLLERSGAEVVQHTVRNIRAQAGEYIVDELFRCRYLIGAGGTRCPVYRTLFRELNPRATELQTVTLEHEIEYPWKDPDCHLWFFERGLPGYSWYVPKQNGWLNVGVGGMAERIKSSRGDIRDHWSHLQQTLERSLAPGANYEPTGYSYFLRGRVEVVRRDNAFITGDAAGLATRDMAEGIGPAIRSGQRAARSILEGAAYSLQDVTGASLGGGWVSRALDWAMTRGHAPLRTPAVHSPAK
ncbi:MAG TPA: NAD(P)/FAD-dependent oxidoreductase [Steroidobacteraceae bacterium]|nr:NAD(P)/FAD-dependent oxidoreductase [Steroidobacteraceae bacterium]